MYQTLIIVIVLFFTCSNTTTQQIEETKPSLPFTDSLKTTIVDRFHPPTGYKAVQTDSSSFAHYLQQLPLKPIHQYVRYYNGQEKRKANIYCSVIDMEIDPQDLQQCADAVMRLRGEYLFGRKKYDDIHFNFVSDSKPRYFKDYAKGDYSYAKFRRYMKYIFSYANTASLHDELISQPINKMQIGDVFVQKRNPYGHAVIVVNMAMDSSGNKLFMLAQSYMPAQETQVLINPTNSKFSPWYQLKEGNLQTPEWTFTSSDLKHF